MTPKLKKKKREMFYAQFYFTHFTNLFWAVMFGSSLNIWMWCKVGGFFKQANYYMA